MSKIPINPIPFPPVKRDTPISPRENLLLALNHQKPVWMPNLYRDSQMVTCKSSRDMAPSKGAAGVDWFGTNYIYSESVGCNMPAGGVFDDVTQWRDKVKWPDLASMDWSHDADGFVRDENRCLYTRLSNGIFERLHAFEGFEQCLLDMMIEPDECRDLFNRIADYKIELAMKYLDVFPLDFVVCADDYGTARAPFFSTAMYEDLLLEPTKRYVKAIQSRGVKFLAHCCGVVMDFIPYFADELGVDGVELQSLNDLPWIVNKYGDRLLVEVNVKSDIMYDETKMDEELIAHARDIVDTYGAHVNPGSGATCCCGLGLERNFRIVENELYHYSLEKYRTIQPQ